MYRDLFANITIVVAFLFSIGQLFKNRSQASRLALRIQGILGIAFGFMGIILMLYSIHATNIIIVDLRNIAIISSGIIGGPISILIAAIVIALFRLTYFGVNSASIVAVIVALICGVGCAYLANTKLSRKIKFVCMFFFTMLITTGAFFYLLGGIDKTLSVLSYYYTISFIGALISFYTIEYINISNESLKAIMYYKVMADNLSDMISIHTLDSTCIYLSPYSIQLLGYRPDDLIGLKLIEFVHPNDLESVKSFFKYTLDISKSGMQAFRIKNKQEKYIWIEVSAKEIRNKDGSIKEIICVSRDITKRKYEEEELIRINREIKVQKDEVEKQKLKALEANQYKSIFLASMSHEIRTPMNGIIGFLELLDYTNLSLSQKEYISEAKGASEILLYLINDILDFSKIEAGRLDIEYIEFDINKLIDSAVNSIVRKANEKGLLLSTQVSPIIPQMVIGDPTRLRQILQNLLSNAVKFTETGEITVCTDIANASEEDLNIRFEVKDTGIGISENDMKKLFKPFLQADTSTTRKYGGTGLGLAISNELVKLMGGNIQVKSEFGKESSFTFTIKLKACEKSQCTHIRHNEFKQDFPVAGNGETPKNERKNITNYNLKILLVEDSDMNIKLIQSLLKSKRITCDIALNGNEAVKACEKKDYDIIFMDCQMPVMDGYQATEAIRLSESEKKHTLIVAITANALVGDKEKCIESGMDDYLSKPITMKSFFGIIDKYFSTDMLRDVKESNDILEGKKYTDYIDTVVGRLVAEAYFEPSDARNTITEYIKKLPNEYSFLERLIAQGNIEDSIHLLHKLKGTSINLRMLGLSELMAEFEVDVKESGASAASIYLKMFKNYFERIS